MNALHLQSCIETYIDMLWKVLCHQEIVDAKIATKLDEWKDKWTEGGSSFIGQI